MLILGRFKGWRAAQHLSTPARPQESGAGVGKCGQLKKVLESVSDSSDGFATKKPRLREAVLYPPASLRAKFGDYPARKPSNNRAITPDG